MFKTGKTIAYAIPVIQDLQSQQPKIQRHDGPVALVIVPTREVRETKNMVKDHLMFIQMFLNGLVMLRVPLAAKGAFSFYYL